MTSSTCRGSTSWWGAGGGRDADRIGDSAPEPRAPQRAQLGRSVSSSAGTCPTCLLDRRGDFTEDLRREHRLVDEHIGTALESHLTIRLPNHRREEDDRQQRKPCSHDPGEVESAHARERSINSHGVEAAVDAFECLLAGGHGDDVESDPSKEQLQETTVVRLVLHRQETDRCGCSFHLPLIGCPNPALSDPFGLCRADATGRAGPVPRAACLARTVVSAAPRRRR